MLQEQIRARIRRPGAGGFTLIELLIVVVVIGILATIAIPQFTSSKEQAVIAKLKSDLRNLVTAEETYYIENDTYTDVLADLPDYNSSSDVTVTINTATGTGWEATATSTGTTQTCAVAAGDATNSLDATATPGEVVCQ